MIEHLPALQVVVPMMGAAVCLLLRGPRLAWAWTFAVSVASFAMAISMFVTVRDTGSITYAMGGWEAPIGIVYRADALASFVLLIVSGIGAVVSLYAPRSLDAELPLSRHHLFYAAYLLCETGLLGMTITGDAFNVFVFLEIASLSSYVMVGLGPDRRALIAAYRYLIAGALGGTFILIGIGLAYQMTGTLNMDDLALRLPNAYAYAPNAASAFISATSTKVMVYVLARFAYGIYGASFAFDKLDLGVPLMVLALLGIFVSSTVAVFQTNVKRLLAYSSVAQIGYMILGISLATPAGVAAGILHLFNHALIKGGLFMAVGNAMRVTGSAQLSDLAGLGRVMPWTFGAFVVGGMGLIGVPLTAGFVTKWALISALLAEGYWPVAVAALLSSLLAAVYVGRVVEVAWFQEPSDALRQAGEAPLWMLVPTWILIGGSVVFGTWGAFATESAMAAARGLLGAS